MVSGIVLPLECAKAELKDSKFFTSEIILATTNNFQHIQPRTDSGVENLEALFRRGYVLDLKLVKRHLETAKLFGEIQFKYYDIHLKKFVKDFPPEMRQFMQISQVPIPTVFKYDEDNQLSEAAKWVASIIVIMNKVKQHFYRGNLSNSVEIENREFIDQLKSTPFVPETLGIEDAHKPRMRAQVNWESKLFNRNITITEEDSYLFQQYVETIQKQKKREEIIYGVEFRTPPITCSRLWRSFKSMFLGAGPDWVDSPGYWMEFGINLLKDITEAVVSFFGEFWEIVSSPAFISILLMYSLLIIMIVLIEWFCADREEPESEFSASFKANVLTDSTTAVSAIGKNNFYVSLSLGSRVWSCFSLVSGRNLLIPAHMLVHKPEYVTIYKSKVDNHILVDHMHFTVKYVNNAEDIAVISLPPNYPNPFKNISHFFENEMVHGEDLLVNGDGFVPLDSVVIPGGGPKIYAFPDGSFETQINNYVQYNLRGESMCGTVLMNTSGSLKGIHVAGRKTTGTGLALIWSTEVKKQLALAMSETKVLPYEISEKTLADFSGIKLDTKMHINTPTKSNLVESPLYGVYPVVRTPADLSKYGAHTIKDVAKKSFKAVTSVDSQQMDFGVKILESIVPEFDDLSWEEVVMGGELLAPLNKDSSNGYKCDKEKSSYVNFPGRCLTLKMTRELDQFEGKVKEGILDQEVVDRLIWCETLKDELRALSKEGVPRSFRIGTIHNQVFTKRICGNLVRSLMKTRDFHQIMIGCNPYKDWECMAKRLSQCPVVWAGDIAKWDGNMLPQVQCAIAQILLKRYKGKHKEMFDVLLSHIINSLVAVNDDLFLTTHSMPSGCYLTAMLNSLVNKFYTAMWYYREMKGHQQKPTVPHFWDTVVDFVYGDDKLNGIKSDLPFLNAMTMRSFFLDHGMDFTDAKKREILSPGQDFSELTFLKRSFVFHNRLGKIMCPLDWDTLSTSLSWVDCKKDTQQVLSDKIHAFQREIYLYPNYESLLQEFVLLLKSRNFDFVVLPENYLYELYANNIEDIPYF